MRNRRLALLSALALLIASTVVGAMRAGAAPTVGRASNTMVVAVGEVGTTLDPKVFQLGSLNVLMNTQEPFLAYGYRPFKGSPVPLFAPGKFQPSLAQSYTIGSKSIDVTLRHAVSPYGNAVSSDDVKWTIERNIALQTLGVYAMSLMNINLKDPITVLSSTHFRLNTTAASPIARDLLNWWVLAPFDSVEAKKHATSADPWASDWLSTHTASFGPYNVQSFTPGASATLVANPHYWGGEPPIKNIIIRAVADPGNRQELLQTGAAQFVPDLPRDQLTALKGKQGVQVLYVPHTVMSYLVFNFKFKPFANRLVRQGFMYAIPYQALNSVAYHNTAKIAKSAVPSLLPYSKPSLWPYRTNIAKAKQLLRRGGYPHGFSVELDYGLGNPGPENQQVVILLQSALKKVGINLQLKQASSDAAFQASLFAKKNPLSLTGVQPFVPDAGYALTNLATTKGPGDDGNYANPSFDAIVAKAMATTSAATRARELTAAQRIFDSDVPMGLLLEPELGLAFSGGLTGYESLPTGFPYFKYFHYR